MSLTKIECGKSTTTDLVTTINKVVDIIGSSNSEKVFNTVIDMLAFDWSSMADGDMEVITRGYHSIGDYGGGNYLVTPIVNIPSTVILDGLGNFNLGQGLAAVLRHKVTGEIDVHQYGAKGDVVNSLGTNDRLSIVAAMTQAKKFSLVRGSDTWRGSPNRGWHVVFGALSYGLHVSQTEKDAGVTAAILIPESCGFVGKGRNSTTFVCLDGFIEGVHVLANERWATKGSDGNLTIKGFSIWGRRWDGSSAENGIHLNMAMGGYLDVDNYLRMEDIQVAFMKGTGIFISGRGEGLVKNCQSNNNQRGWDIDTYVDSYFENCNAGGNRFTGIRSYKATSCKFVNCKSYYNGVDGGTDEEKSANWAVLSDSWIGGQGFYTSCEAQESHGSGWYITAGMCTFTACLGQDNHRTTIGSQSTLPTVCAGFHLAKGKGGWNQNIAKGNHFINCYVSPGLTLNYSDLYGKSYNGDYAVYIHNECVGNTGNINTYPQSQYTHSCIGGGGIPSPLLSVDYELMNDPRKPTGATVYVKPNSSTSIRIYATQIEEYGHKVTDYMVSYKVTGGTVISTKWLDIKFPLIITGLTSGTSYDLVVTPVSKLGTGYVIVSKPSYVVVNTTQVFVNTSASESKYFKSNSKLIDLDESIIKIIFTVSDRIDLNSSVQSIITQSNDLNETEFEFSLIGQYNYRINVGGVIFSGGVGKPLDNSTWTLVIQPIGIYLYKDGILEGEWSAYVRGTVRVADAVTKVMKKNSTYSQYKGAVRLLTLPRGTYLFDDNTSALQPCVSGDLSTSFSLVDNGGGGSWQDLPLL